MFLPRPLSNTPFFGSGVGRRLVLAAAMLAAVPAAAQEVPRSAVSVGPVAGRPAAEFRDRMGDGYGLGLRSLQRLDARGWLALRIEGGFLLQERQRDEIPTSETGSLELATSNTLVFAGIGPQVGLPRGPVRPYAHAFAGMHYLVTEAAYEGRTREGESFEVVSNFEDQAFAYGGGAGVYVPLRAGRSPLSLDAGVTWRAGGRATYLQQGPYADGAPAHEPVSGRTDRVMVHLGVALGW